MSSEELSIEELAPIKTPVEARCPECGAEELRQYPVLAVGGWFQVIKCQRCLCSVERVPWNRLGWITLAEDNAL
jgi:vanillate/4-hydroxybenzoate decarboxylase subunit D